MSLRFGQEVQALPRQVTRRAPRSRKRLEDAITSVRGQKAGAIAHFELAILHDNNSREAEAIPHYEAALRLGLDRDRRAEALAWLASSLYKTGHPQSAMRRLTQSQRITQSDELKRFLDGLKRRIRRTIDRA